nr:MAG TPA: hypothetical protein [Caudoviricetes sp.]
MNVLRDSRRKAAEHCRSVYEVSVFFLRIGSIVAVSNFGYHNQYKHSNTCGSKNDLCSVPLHKGKNNG